MISICKGEHPSIYSSKDHHGCMHAHWKSLKHWTTAQHKSNQHWQAHSFGPILFEARQTAESIGPHHKQHAQQTTPEQTQIWTGLAGKKAAQRQPQIQRQNLFETLETECWNKISVETLKTGQSQSFGGIHHTYNTKIISPFPMSCSTWNYFVEVAVGFN